MKAAVYTAYGAPDVVTIQHVEKPTPGTNEVLVRIHAATVSTADVRLRGMDVPPGFRLITRLVFGLTKPRTTILGGEFAGEVEAAGDNVTQFRVGDRVFGAREKLGSHAEYNVVSEDEPIAHLPANLSYEEAAAVPFGALTSLVYLRDFGKIQPGQRILINGASGALGVYGVQLAKYFGAEVTGVCSTRNIELVKSLGADAVIDYTKENLGHRGEAYDIVYDTVGKLSFAQCKPLLKPDGRCLFAVAGIPDFLKVLWTSVFGRKKLVAGVAVFKKDDLMVIRELLESGKLKPVIDQRFMLEQIVEAHAYVDSGHKRGSVIIVPRAGD